jgi:hypothetical protein
VLFRSKFGAGFKEGDSAEIHIKDTSNAAFKALLNYLYTDSMEVDDAVLCDPVKSCDQYGVERLHNHCLLCQRECMRLIICADKLNTHNRWVCM